MKKISLISLLLIATFSLVNLSGTTPNAPEDIQIKIAAYKQQYALSCGVSTEVEDFELPADIPFIDAWKNTLAPFDAPEAYNTLFIPDTLSGIDFSLRIHDTSAQYMTGIPTHTMAYNDNSILGPTLIFRKGTTVHMHVENDLKDTTTVHWHGMHLPAIMDGGPHEPIAPGATWSPEWLVKNNAATYWYHPHLHMKTTEHIIKGLAGMIIVHDDAEEALNIPRTYGVDDIPLVLNDKRFNANNQLVICHYGDTMMCNGTLNAQYNIPSQVVRFRVLNGANERSYNLGFSDDRDFYVIADDASLLNKPVAVKRYILSPGERIEILVNFSSQEGETITLKAYNSKLPNDIPGTEPNKLSTPKSLRNKLGRRDFDILRLDITSPTSHALLTIPSTLVKTGGLDSTKASVIRTINMENATNCAIPSFGCYTFNNNSYNMDNVDYKVRKGAVEIWQITNNSNISHPFHIHDVSFKILNRSDGPVAAYEKGWKDVVLVRRGTTVRFIAKFADYADSVHPYMFHCHITMHEDAGMMGQFVVMPPTKNNLSSVTATSDVAVANKNELKVFPNPFSNSTNILFTLSQSQKVSLNIFDASGRFVKAFVNLPSNAGEHQLIWNARDENGNAVNAGIYFLKLQAGAYSETKKIVVMK
jgi:blue copper oxidase